MLTLVLTLGICVVVFVLAFASPRFGRKTQALSKQVMNKVHRKLNSKSKIHKYFIGKPTNVSHRALNSSAELGKRARKKVPF